MMKINQFHYSLIGVITLTLGLSACSSPADKANKIEEKLPENASVLYKDILSENPQIVTTQMEPDSSVVSLVHSLKSGQVDTLSHIRKDGKIIEVVPVEDGYLSVYREPRSDGNEHFLYLADIQRNIGNPKERSSTTLKVADGNEDIWASSYVIDKDSKKITLSSYDVKPSFVEIYHTVYDFKGNKIADDPLHINIPQPSAQPAESTKAMYLWECDKCGKRVNSDKKPRVWGTFGFEGCINASNHQWVNLGRVN